MREIKFRGYIPPYLTMKGRWVYGLLVHYNVETATIVNNEELYVAPSNTIGQFTGLHDKNGVEIYEGDILETIDYKKYPNSLEHSINALPVYVIYEDGCFRVRWLREKPALPQDKPYQLLNSALDQPFLRSGLVVIGNIHEEELK